MLGGLLIQGQKKARAKKLPIKEPLVEASEVIILDKAHKLYRETCQVINYILLTLLFGSFTMLNTCQDNFERFVCSCPSRIGQTLFLFEAT